MRFSPVSISYVPPTAYPIYKYQSFLLSPGSGSLCPSTAPSTSVVLPFLLKRLNSVVRFPSGLDEGEVAVILDHTLGRRLVPSALVRGG
jgi:hypothetical protein